MKNAREIIPKEFSWCIPKIFEGSSRIIFQENFATKYAFYVFLFNRIF